MKQWCKNRGKLRGMYRIVYRPSSSVRRALCLRCGRVLREHAVAGLPRHLPEESYVYAQKDARATANERWEATMEDLHGAAF